MVLKHLAQVLLAGISLLHGGYAQVHDIKANLSIGWIVYPGFTPLDIFGPLEQLYHASSQVNMTLSTISFSAGPVSARPPRPLSVYPDPHLIDPIHKLNPTILATHSFDTAPPIDILIVPGGAGQFLLDNENNRTMEDFIASRFEAAQYVLSVCVGATALARAGVLKGRRATTNKAAWKWATDERHGKGIEWVPSARWVVDGKVWTSSGVAAGMDMMWAFMGHYYGEALANDTVNAIEYTPHVDPHWDAFAVVHDVPGADRNRSLTDCVKPAGY